MLADYPISWFLKKLTIVAQSSTESKYIIISKATKKAVQVRCLLEKLC